MASSVFGGVYLILLRHIALRLGLPLPRCGAARGTASCWQVGSQGSSARNNRRHTVSMESSWCRCVLCALLFICPDFLVTEGKSAFALGEYKGVSAKDGRDMVVPARIASPFVMIKSQLLFHFSIHLLGSPPGFTQVHKLIWFGALWKVGQVVFAGGLFLLSWFGRSPRLEFYLPFVFVPPASILWAGTAACPQVDVRFLYRGSRKQQLGTGSLSRRFLYIVVWPPPNASLTSKSLYHQWCSPLPPLAFWEEPAHSEPPSHGPVHHSISRCPENEASADAWHWPVWDGSSVKPQ